VYKLKNVLYGLKQAPRAWIKFIDLVLSRHGHTSQKHTYRVRTWMIYSSLEVQKLILRSLRRG